jgi:tetratricopeptide (TPR) repeat protein
MSSRRVLFAFTFGALTSLIAAPRTTQTAPQNASVADLLLKDEIQRAEALLEKQPKTAQNVAFRGEIEFRRGHFAEAESFYREAVKLDPKNARGHSGLGKLAMARVKTRKAFRSSPAQWTSIRRCRFTISTSAMLSVSTRNMPSSESISKNTCG